MNRNIEGSDAESDGKGRSRATVAELYPEVGRILLFFALEPAGAESEPSFQQIIFTPETEGVFRLDCSREECTGGGFDFAPVVDEMVKNGETMAHGKLACAGILGPGGERCSLQAEYRLIVD